MRKIVIALCLAALVCGCKPTKGMENADYKKTERLEYPCVNEHLYIKSWVHGGYTYSPLFAADSDTPMLVRCPGKDLSQVEQ